MIKSVQTVIQHATTQNAVCLNVHLWPSPCLRRITISRFLGTWFRMILIDAIDHV